MSISAEIKKLFSAARLLGSGDDRVTLSENELFCLLTQCCNDLAIPIAVFDTNKIAGDLEVRRATGRETYLTFGGETEHPEPDEVIFADGEGRAHARRWTNRQSGLSAVRETTGSVLIVAEALHASAGEDIERLVATVVDALARHWPVVPKTAMLTSASPRFEFEG